MGINNTWPKVVNISELRHIFVFNYAPLGISFYFCLTLGMLRDVGTLLGCLSFQV